MSAAATRDDLAAVVTTLTEQAATQRKWQAEYEAKAKAVASTGHPREEQAMYERFAALARGTANGFEVSVDMIRKYVAVPE